MRQHTQILNTFQSSHGNFLEFLHHILCFHKIPGSSSVHFPFPNCLRPHSAATTYRPMCCSSLRGKPLMPKSKRATCHDVNTDTAFTGIYIYIYDRHNSCKENQLDAQFIFSTSRQNSTRFGRNHSPSLGGTQ